MSFRLTLDSYDEKNQLGLAPREVSFQGTEGMIKYNNLDIKYKYTTKDGNQVVEDLIFDLPLCSTGTGVSIKKKKVKAPDAAAGAAAAAAKQLEEKMAAMMAMMAGKSAAPAAPAQTAILGEKKEDKEEKKEEKKKEQIKFSPKDEKDIPKMRNVFDTVRKVGVQHLARFPQLANSMATKEDEASRIVAASDLFFAPYLVQMENKKPVPGSRATYVAKINYNSVFTLPTEPGKEPHTFDMDDVRNKAFDFYPSIHIQTIFCNGALAKFDIILLSGIIIGDIKEAKERNIPTNLNSALIQADPTLVAKASDQLARLKAKKAAAAKKEGGGTAESKAEAAPAGTVTPGAATAPIIRPLDSTHVTPAVVTPAVIAPAAAAPSLAAYMSGAT